MSQPSWAPLRINSRRRRCRLGRRSDGERSSTTKSGQSGGNFSRWSRLSASHRSRRTHAASGERSAPLGSTQPTDESKASPLPSRWAQLASWRHTSRLRADGAARRRHQDQGSVGVTLNPQVTIQLAGLEELFLVEPDQGREPDHHGRIPALDAGFGNKHGRLGVHRRSYDRRGSSRGGAQGRAAATARNIPTGSVVDTSTKPSGKAPWRPKE